MTHSLRQAPRQAAQLVRLAQPPKEVRPALTRSTGTLVVL